MAKKSSKNIKRPLIIGITVLVFAVATMAVGYWYMGWFAKDPLKDGPVVVNPSEVPKIANPAEYIIEPAVGGFVVPWSMVFTSANRWLVSERSGAVRVVENDTLLKEPLTTIKEVSSKEEEGLMGLALHPKYRTNRLVYACYAAPGEKGLVDKVVRFTDDGNHTGPLQIVLDSIPSAQNHAGCRLGFGPDGKLYITTGDASTRDIAQDIKSLGGKILRLNDDGSIPADNPRPNSPVWSMGHRNPQGIAWQPGTGDLYETEHGPSIWDGPAGGDEVNRIERGKNYGWPIVSHDQTDPRFVTPLITFTPAVAPGGAAFYNSDALPQFKGNLFFAGLKGQGLYRVVFDDKQPSNVVLYEKMRDVDAGRLRDVVAGPDGNLYFMTSNRDGRGAPRDGDDQVYRIRPTADD